MQIAMSSRPLMLALGLVLTYNEPEESEEPTPEGEYPGLLWQFGVTSGPIYLLYQDDYLMYAFATLSEAVQTASDWHLLSEPDPDSTKVLVIDEADDIPTEVYDRLLDHGAGTSPQSFKDGYDAAQAAIPYITKEEVWKSEEEDTEERDWWKTEAEKALEKLALTHIPAGTLLYHGTATEEAWEKGEDPYPPAWFSNVRDAAAWFATWREGPRPRILTYRTRRDLNGLLDLGREDFEIWREAIGSEDVQELAEETCSHASGWVIPNNYPEHRGDDILLCDTSDLELISVEEIQS